MTHEPAANIVRLVCEELSRTSAALGQSGLEERAAMLRVLADKLRALLESDALTHIEPDFQAMMVADGLAMRAGSRPRLDDRPPDIPTPRYESLTVRFPPGGADEICWHLETWGTHVSIERPANVPRHISAMCAIWSPTTVRMITSTN